MTIAGLLDISPGSVIAVIGCGGKTSLIGLISGGLSEKKVLVTPTAKILPMRSGKAVLCETLMQCMKHEPQTGVQCLGLLNEKSGKLEALPEHILFGMIPDYDIVILEADGSSGLPCKGWMEYEPVIPDCCTHTVGVVTMNALGKSATDEIVHRLPEFLALTGLQPGGTITMQALESMVLAPRGMFKKSAGKRCLVVNQVEDETSAGNARSYLQNIKEKYHDRFERLIYGSVRLDVWREV